LKLNGFDFPVFQFHGPKKPSKIEVHAVYFDRGIWFAHSQPVFVRIKTSFTQTTLNTKNEGGSDFITNFL
jgi:hypothetical protein